MLLIDVEPKELGAIEGLTELIIGLIEGPIEPEAPLDEPVAAELPRFEIACNDGPEIVDRKVCVDVGAEITDGYALVEKGEGRGALLTGVVVPCTEFKETPGADGTVDTPSVFVMDVLEPFGAI
jgi:hypothetical protein